MGQAAGEVWCDAWMTMSVNARRSPRSTGPPSHRPRPLLDLDPITLLTLSLLPRMMHLCSNTHRLSNRFARTAVLCFLVAAFTGCNTVEFYEMQAHSSNVMEYGSSDAKSHLEQKVLYSMEGSAGGIGTSAGGGCGCY